MIKYSLHLNNLNTGVENYHAIVQSNTTLDMNQVIKEMIKQGSGVSEAVAEAVLKDFFSTLEKLLLYGFRVSTPMVICGVSIQGVFENSADSFDPNRHTVNLVCTPTRQAQRSLQGQAQVQKQLPQTPQPHLLQYLNLHDTEGGPILTPGDVSQVIGSTLGFDEADPNQGVFLVDTDGSSRRMNRIVRHTPTDLLFLVPPDLTAGEYRLEVRAQFGAEMRIGTYKQSLTVA